MFLFAGKAPIDFQFENQETWRRYCQGCVFQKRRKEERKNPTNPVFSLLFSQFLFYHLTSKREKTSFIWRRKLSKELFIIKSLWVGSIWRRRKEIHRNQCIPHKLKKVRKKCFYYQMVASGQIITAALPIEASFWFQQVFVKSIDMPENGTTVESRNDESHSTQLFGYQGASIGQETFPPSYAATHATAVPIIDFFKKRGRR